MTKKKKQKYSPGRPTKLNVIIIDELVELLETGVHVETACSIAGIRKKDFYDWMKLALDPEKNNIYKTFRDRVRRAMGLTEKKTLLNVKEAGDKGDWRAAAWMLERRFPKRWAKQDPDKANEPTKVTFITQMGEDGVSQQVVKETSTDVMEQLENEDKSEQALFHEVEEPENAS